MTRLWLLMALVGLALAACGPRQNPPLRPTPTPTPLPAPVAMRTPTVTATPTLSPSPTPGPTEVILDNSKADFDGKWGSGDAVRGSWGSDFRWSAPGTGSNRVVWSTRIPRSCRYDVYVRWTSAPDRASNAWYGIGVGNTSLADERVDQRQQGGEWVWLGAFDLPAGQWAWVNLTDKADGLVIADAVRWTLVGDCKS